MSETSRSEKSIWFTYNGTFKGNYVVVNKMKEVGVSEASMDSFRTEVAMLDKFPCDFVFHFFGACFIPNHVTMVTEFVPYRSLADCIQKRPDPDDRTKAKLMLDAARGISYLHGNGIPHQDVKPDNALVFSLDEVLTVNGELTNFGSLRNVHLIVTNMTFTKGIGSPVFIASEVIPKEDKNKKAADIFSFAITMFECMKWGEAYPKELFKFPWDVVTFVSSEKTCPTV